MNLTQRNVLQLAAAALVGLGAGSTEVLGGSAFPATISLVGNDRVRLDPVNPHNDEVRALIHARKRP
jgi:hypothetical protein